jgi:hypothetical protein
MNKFTKQFHTEAHDVRLTSAERSRIEHALRQAMGTSVATPSPFFISSFYFSRALVAVALILVVGGTTAFAAEGTLPGDLLYPVKVGVNEPFTGALAFSNTAKATWHADVAETRLSEAETLAENGTLTASTSDELETNFNEHASAVAMLARDIGAENADSGHAISLKFSSLVARHGAAILAAGKRSKNPIALHASGNLVVNVAGNESRGEHEAKMSVGVSAAAPVLLAANNPGDENTSTVQALSTRAHAALALATSTLSASGEGERNTRLLAVENLVLKADAELSIGFVQDASRDFQAALEELQALRTTNIIQTVEGTVKGESTDETENRASSPNLLKGD